MAKVTITIEDLPNGRVKAVAEPNYEFLMKVTVNSEDLSPAQAYGVVALNAIRDASKGKNPLKIIIPNVRKGIN